MIDTNQVNQSIKKNEHDGDCTRELNAALIERRRLEWCARELKSPPRLGCWVTLGTEVEGDSACALNLNVRMRMHAALQARRARACKARAGQSAHVARPNGTAHHMWVGAWHS